MKLSLEAYKAMLINQVQQGKLTPKAATRLFKKFVENQLSFKRA